MTQTRGAMNEGAPGGRPQVRWSFVLVMAGTTIVALCLAYMVYFLSTITPKIYHLDRYAGADRAVVASGARPDVLFVGDSITELWSTRGASSWQPNWLNRGIGGERSDQVRARFAQDVLALRPRTVVILVGTNDAWVNNPAEPLVNTEANIAAMAERARDVNIRVLIASVPPIGKHVTAHGLPMPRHAEERIEAQNAWTKDYAARKGDCFVDYWRVMSPALTVDGVHPSEAGYALMGHEVERCLSPRAR